MDMSRSASNVKRIILEREDGTTDVITRGLIADYTECAETDTGEVHFDLCGLSGKEVGMVVISMLQLGQQLGMFDVSDEEGDTE